jgi:hypothetical protein
MVLKVASGYGPLKGKNRKCSATLKHQRVGQRNDCEFELVVELRVCRRSEHSLSVLIWKFPYQAGVQMNAFMEKGCFVVVLKVL